MHEYTKVELQAEDIYVQDSPSNAANAIFNTRVLNRYEAMLSVPKLPILKRLMPREITINDQHTSIPVELTIPKTTNMEPTRYFYWNMLHRRISRMLFDTLEFSGPYQILANVTEVRRPTIRQNDITGIDTESALAPQMFSALCYTLVGSLASVYFRTQSACDDLHRDSPIARTICDFFFMGGFGHDMARLAEILSYIPS